jgi:hypothetical protein
MSRSDEQRKVEQRARLAALEGRHRAGARRVAVATAKDRRSPPRDIGLGLALGIAALPVVFSWFTLRRGCTALVRILAFLWLAAFLGIGVWPG